MGNPERSNKALKRKKTTQKIIAAVSIALLAVLIGVLMTRKHVQSEYGNRGKSTVESTQVETGSIRTTVTASGTLTSEDLEDVNIPASVKIDTVFVEQGDTVEEGTLLLSVDTNTVLSAMADVQTQLTALDKKLVTAANDTVKSNISSGISGRIKAVYAEKDDSVSSVMYDHGALALISLDGKMAVDAETDAYKAGDTVTVTTSDGMPYEGTVEAVKNGTATITITDNGPLLDDEVSVDGRFTGKLYIHAPLKVTGYAGTVSIVSVKENTLVYNGTTLFTLTDTSFTANYDQLLEQRADYEDLYQDLVKLYVDGGLSAPMAGTIESIIDPDAEDTASTASATASASSAASAMSAYSAAAASASSSSSSDLLAETKAATIDPNKKMSVTINVDETDILSLAVGQEVSLTVESIGEETYSGIVEEIDTTAANTTTSNTSAMSAMMGVSGVTSTGYSAKIILDKAPFMLSGMTADASITIEGVENAMLLPVDAVHKTSASYFVYTTYDAETDTLGGMTEVTVGISNGKQMEITGGLKPGDTVFYIPKEQTFRFGAFTITTGGSSRGSRSGMGGGMPNRPPQG